MSTEDRLTALLKECGQEGWDSYGGLALTMQAVDAFDARMERSIAPSPRGYIEVEIDLPNDGCIMFGVLPDGSIDGLYVKSPDGAEVEWEQS